VSADWLIISMLFLAGSRFVCLAVEGEGEGGWEAHHLVPESDGGSDKLDNCAITCWPCHSKTL